ncbi:MAG TPA: thiamine pyrophosphate-dependent enzyme, partial [Anaerolineales bacterium]|nr:thiamine pyrophosphate-dependent enzyme [Anaerolineales bacterium]
IELALAGEIPARFAAFGIHGREVDTSDVQEVAAAAREEIRTLRKEGGPRALVIHTVRFGPHSKGDDTREEKLMAKLRATRDPLQIHSKRLSAHQRNDIEAEVKAQVVAAFEEAQADPPPSL